MVEHLRRCWIEYTIAAVVVSIGLLIFWPRQHMMRIVSMDWVRWHQMEILSTVQHHNASWVPSGGRQNGYRLKRVCSHNGKVENCHYESRFDYEIEEFVNGRSVSTSGVFGSKPRWPDYTLSGPTGPRGTGQERLGGSYQTYTVNMKTDEGDRYSDELPENEWNEFSPAQVVFCTTVAGMVVKIRPMESQ